MVTNLEPILRFGISSEIFPLWLIVEGFLEWMSTSDDCKLRERVLSEVDRVSSEEKLTWFWSRKIQYFPVKIATAKLTLWNPSNTFLVPRDYTEISLFQFQPQQIMCDHNKKKSVPPKLRIDRKDRRHWYSIVDPKRNQINCKQFILI